MTIPRTDIHNLTRGWVALGAALGVNTRSSILVEAFRRIELVT